MKERTIAQLGEFGFIERVAQKIRVDKSVVHGIGDDAAVLAWTKDKYLLFTTDMLVENVHFRREEASFLQIGRKALGVNISDIAAMGGIPTYAQVAVGMPPNLLLSAADELMRGISALAKEFDINVTGGDTVRSEFIVLCISLLGEVRRRDLTLRSGAKEGDLIFVTGRLGGSRKLKQFNFIPRIKEAQEIIKQFRPTAMLDVSDGLASDLCRLCESSQAGAVIFEQMIPLSPGAFVQNALYDGEDFELLFTMSLENARKFYQESLMLPGKGVPAISCAISCIGRIVQKKEGLTIIDQQARVLPLEQKGFKHF